MQLQVKQIIFHQKNEPLIKKKVMVIPQINEEDYKECLKEINETFKIIKDSETGHAFEIAIVNKKHLKKGAILMPSTMFSSLTQNRGNAIELAAAGAADPNTARVYIAFPGNGGSDDLIKSDRQYVAHTGRFTRNGKALESIIALVNALEDDNILIKSISANVEACRLGLGIMAALPEHTVSSVYFNGIPNISPPQEGTFVSQMIKADREDDPLRNHKEDNDEDYKVSDSLLVEAKSFLPKIYKGYNYFSRLAKTYLHAIPNLTAYRKAFSSHDDLQSINNHAVLQDTLTALNKQRYTKVTFQFGQFSRLHNIVECKKFAKILTRELNKTSYQESFQLFIYAGSLDFHTSFPSRRWAIEKCALMEE